MRKRLQSTLTTLMILGAMMFYAACGDNDPDDPQVDPESYDRAAMLNNLADNYIVPSYNNYVLQTDSLKNVVNSFTASPSLSGLLDVRNQWKEALLTWQDVAFLEFGPAESISLRGQTNVYPIDTTVIIDNITTGSYDLQLPANFVGKGFQALDFLLYKPGFTDQDIVDYYTNNANAVSYIQDVATELYTNADYVYSQWQSSYTATFKGSNTSNAQGSSVSNMVNALSMHYETYVRKGKVGLPSGAFNGFSQTPMPDHVEAYYYGQSLPFAVREMVAIGKYIRGEGYTTGTNGQGLDDYLNHVEAQSGGQNLSVVIDSQITVIISNMNAINDPLSDEVVNNTQGVETLYQSMQLLVPYIKVDLTAALGVLVTYQDNDGD